MSKDAATQLLLESQIVVRNLKVRDLQLIKDRDAGSYRPGEDAVTQAGPTAAARLQFSGIRTFAEL